MRAGSVSISATPGVGVYLLPVWLQAFRGRYPHLRAAVATQTTPQVVSALRDGLADIGVIEGEVEDGGGLELRTLEDVEQFVIVGSDHPWWDMTEVPIGALNGMAIIQRQAASQSRRWLEAILVRFGIVPVTTAEFDNVESIKRTVSAGKCLAILPAYTVTQEESAGLLRRVRISGSPLRRALKIAWPEHARSLSPVSRAFIGEVARFFPAALLD
jgi:DNA-binding transcriptional LysR family regulator